MSNSTATLRAAAGKYLTFQIGEESFGIAVLKVREIIRLTAITAVPQLPAHIKGVINLRGKIIPVTDLRARFGVRESEDREHTCIVVVQMTAPTGVQTQMGVIVDSVEEVINITHAEIEETPDFGAAANTEGILGMAKVKGMVKTLLDIDNVLGSAGRETVTPSDVVEKVLRSSEQPQALG